MHSKEYATNPVMFVLMQNHAFTNITIFPKLIWW